MVKPKIENICVVVVVHFSCVDGRVIGWRLLGVHFNSIFVRIWFDCVGESFSVVANLMSKNTIKFVNAKETKTQQQPSRKKMVGACAKAKMSSLLSLPTIVCVPKRLGISTCQNGTEQPNRKKHQKKVHVTVVSVSMAFLLLILLVLRWWWTETNFTCTRGIRKTTTQRPTHPFASIEQWTYYVEQPLSIQMHTKKLSRLPFCKPICGCSCSASSAPIFIFFTIL